jgi:predicted glycoside hydrolase/deacetylase ChbG (UPF0249 family)
MARVIINSDDYGMNPSINDAIISAFYSNLISSTTCLVNYPEGLIDGHIKLVENNIKMSSVGIHLNLTTGKPLTESISKNSLFCENGFFHSRVRDTPLLILDKKSRIDVIIEIEAQIQRFIEVMGCKPSHIDGHHHIHTEFAIFRIIVGLAKKFDISCMRKTRNLGIDRIGIVKKIYKGLLNFLIERNFRTTNFFGSLADLDGQILGSTKTYEIMVHAVFLDNSPGVVFDDDGKDLGDKIKKLKRQNYLLKTVALCDYCDLN